MILRHGSVVIFHAPFLPAVLAHSLIGKVRSTSVSQFVRGYHGCSHIKEFFSHLRRLDRRFQLLHLRHVARFGANTGDFFQHRRPMLFRLYFAGGSKGVQGFSCPPCQSKAVLIIGSPGSPFRG